MDVDEPPLEIVWVPALPGIHVPQLWTHDALQQHGQMNREQINQFRDKQQCVLVWQDGTVRVCPGPSVPMMMLP